MLNNTNLHLLDLTKYKRLFVFGCSFTSYGWPTWADVLSREMPQAEFYNFGYPGAGNLMISCRLTEADHRYKFDENDLVVVMWSTICREDRYKNNQWWRGGGIFASEIYSQEYARQYADAKGYLIRDLALFTMASTWMESVPATCITLSSVPINFQQDEKDTTIQPILDLYADTIDKILPDILTLELDGNWSISMLYRNKQGERQRDGHPSPDQYYNYLVKLGFPMTPVSLKYANDSTELLTNLASKAELFYAFAEIKDSKTKTIL